MVKISFVSIENGIFANGFRRMASLARQIHPNTEICYISPEQFWSISRFLFRGGKIKDKILKDDISIIALHLAQSDIVCFSSMTAFSELTKEIISAIKVINKKIIVVWGGIHPIVCPDDAIQYADAVCTGEGEVAFKQFLFSYINGDTFTGTKNFWFNENGKITKNPFLPLQTNEELNSWPFPLYADSEMIFKSGLGFVPLTTKDYISIYGSAYMAIWTIGCPYGCSYCSNSKFIQNDANYRKIRHSSADYIIAEIRNALEKHPHLASVSFVDDSFLVLPTSVLEEFAEKWKADVNIPFCVLGVTPGAVKKKKIDLLIKVGMNRVRMGIQSGSDRILEFYKRPTKRLQIQESATILSSCAGKMIPPNYDIIVDNPIETIQDVHATLEMLYTLPRPYYVNVFGLRGIPNTELVFDLERRNIKLKSISEGFTTPVPTLANALVYIIAVTRLPEAIFRFLLKFAKPSMENQSKYPIVFNFFRIIHLFQRAAGHLAHFDFSYFPGWVGRLYWRTGLSKLQRKRREQGALK